MSASESFCAVRISYAAHNAAADVEATGRCFLELIRVGKCFPPMTSISPKNS